MRLGAQSGKTPAQSVKQLIFFHWMPQNDGHRLALVLTSMWKSYGKRGLSAGLAPRLEPLINRFAQKQQWQFVLSSGEVCRGHNGNQVASAFQGGFERWGLIPPQEPSPSPSATSAPRACTSFLGVGAAAVGATTVDRAAVGDAAKRD